MQSIFKRLQLILAIIAFIHVSGCATRKVDWQSRVGNYTYDQAVVEFGPPERSAKLSDGRMVSEWLVHRGGVVGSNHYSPGFGGFANYDATILPDRLIRLTFSPKGHLESWKKVTK